MPIILINFSHENGNTYDRRPRRRHFTCRLIALSVFTADISSRAYPQTFCQLVCSLQRVLLASGGPFCRRAPVSYTHLDVYKRQLEHIVTMSGSSLKLRHKSQSRHDLLAKPPKLSYIPEDSPPSTRTHTRLT